MLDLAKTKEHFFALSHDEQLHELTSIFESIKDKNDNCAYIYGKLTTNPQLFDEQLIGVIFDDVLQVYQQVESDNANKQAQELTQMTRILEKIHHAEDMQKSVDESEAEKLLADM